jgi:probable F420-dependent oxidoreductase
MTATVAITAFGVESLFGGDVRALVDVAEAADELGIGQVVLPDHVLIGAHTDRYPFGTFPAPPERPWPEPLTVLAAIAARTRRIRLSTGVLVSPLRPAALLAKTVATLDALSGGRVDLGVGTGWQREEYDASGVPFEHRGRRMDDQLRACRALWADAPARFESSTVSFDDSWCRPAPVQAGGVPIWFGGPGTAATGRRIAELGVGWLPIAGTNPDDVAAGIEVIRGELATDDLGVRVTAPVVPGDLDATIAACRPFLDAGATAVAFPLLPFLPDRGAVDGVLHRLAGALEE